MVQANHGDILECNIKIIQYNQQYRSKLLPRQNWMRPTPWLKHTHFPCFAVIFLVKSRTHNVLVKSEVLVMNCKSLCLWISSVGVCRGSWTFRYNYAKKRTCKSITTSLSTLEAGSMQSALQYTVYEDILLRSDISSRWLHCTFSLQGAAIMNNTFCLAIFLALVHLPQCILLGSK